MAEPRAIGFEDLLEATPDALVGVDPGGRIVFANTQAATLFGYEREDLVGKTVDTLTPLAARAVHPAHRARYLQSPTPRPMGAGMELAARRRDGTEFPAEISLKALPDPAGALVVAAIRDVTDRLEAHRERERLRAEAERQRMESRLQQAQRLESLGQLAGGVAHDFNNLLAVISNYADFVADEIAAAVQVEGDQGRWSAVLGDVEQIRRAAARATGLTRQLLAFGRREVVHPQLMDVNDVVGEVQEMLRRTIGEHVELIVRLSSSMRPVMADPGHVEQVLVNLAVNARDAMPGGGTLSIETDVVDVDDGWVGDVPELKPGCFVRLRVSDTGSGMSREVVQHAFEPFFTTKPKGEGTGLGLATVYGIVTQAGGHVHIYSEPSVGSSNTVLLPVAGDGAGEADDPAPAEPARLARDRAATVLIVEDEEAMREVTGRILRGAGYTVIATDSGAQAVELARRSARLDLLLTDVIMPTMLGKEVAERVRAVLPDIRVLYMSGYAQPVLASRGTLDEGVSLIEKPFSRAGLLDKVREVLGP